VFCKQDQNKSGSDERGDQYTYVSFCRDLKLIISFYTGKRSRENTRIHVQGLHGRLAGRTQITTDNYVAYRGKRGAIANTFGRDGVDYGMLTKVYAKSLLPENRYAPPVCILSKKTAIFGQPNRDTICTSHVERQNLNFRQFNRRFTRLILGYLNKLKTCAIRLLCSPASGISVGNTRPQNERRHKRQD
jgi:IS1 family transposase